MSAVDASVWGGGTPLDVESLRSAVQDAIDEMMVRQRKVLAEVSPDLDPMADAIADLLNGGKRLRPAFCYWGYRSAGGQESPEAKVAAASLEFLQACALIHDDVMDGSDTRRGLPAAHRRFERMHDDSRWIGSAAGFGVGAAILLGDMCLTWSDEMLFASGMPEAELLRTKPIFDVMRTELMGGQYLDLLEQVRGGGSVERAMNVVRHKSAKYTIERPLHMGAMLAGAPERTLESLSAYGLPLGEAFQLRDDLLGVFGDPSETGKPAGDDLREGKQTVLIAVALERATPAQREVVHRLLGRADLDATGVASLREVIVDTGAQAFTEDRIASLTARAFAALDESEMEDLPRSILQGLAVAATSRSV
jgi:geranylgeranyl diphosphate synthase, type I